MKKSVFFSVLLLFCFALPVLSQFAVGPRVGLSLSSFAYSYKNTNAEPVARVIPGPSFGVLFNYQFNDVVGLRFGVNHTTKGTAIDVNESYKYLDTVDYYRDGFQRYNLNYIEIPIEGTFGYRKDDHYFFGSVGPYLALFIYGKNKYNYDKYLVNPDGSRVLIDSYDKSKKIKPKNEVTESDLYEDDQYMKPFDLGFYFGIGYQLNFFVVNVQYGLGLLNITPKYTMIENYHKNWKKYNRVISINFAFLFGNKTNKSAE